MNVWVGDRSVEVPPSSKIQSQLVACGELVSVNVRDPDPRRREGEVRHGGDSEYVGLDVSGPVTCSLHFARTKRVIGSFDPRGGTTALVAPTTVVYGSPLIRNS